MEQTFEQLDDEALMAQRDRYFRKTMEAENDAERWRRIYGEAARVAELRGLPPLFPKGAGVGK